MPSPEGIPGSGADGFFGIRLESIGGLGAHLAGQILAEAGVLGTGLDGSQFSSYGSEKKGSPVRSYIRLCPAGRAVRRSDPIERPQLVVVFHQALLGTGNPSAGLAADGTLIVNSASDPREIRERFEIATATIGTVDAMQIAVEEQTRVNTAMLGATARVCAFLDPDVIRETLAARLRRRYPHLVAANLRTFDRGYEELRLEHLEVEGTAVSGTDRPRPAYGYLEAPAGGTIFEPGSSIVRDLSASRQGFLPALDLEKCVHCGLCDIVCPDLCFVWHHEDDDSVRLQGIDYRYCKGCRKCTDVCPTGALTEIREQEGWAAAHRVPLYPWLDEAAAR